MVRPVNFGKHSYHIAFAQWDANQHVGLIQIYDEEGNPFIVETFGMSSAEQRQAVASWAMHREVAIKRDAPIAAEFGKERVRLQEAKEMEPWFTP